MEAERSRTLWLKQGDRNTKFFQRTANAHRRYNHIDQLEVDGEIVKEPVDIKREILSFYQKPYTVTEEWRPGFNMSNNPRIEEAEMLRLQRPFEEE